MKTLRYITLCALCTLLGACSCTQDGVRTIEPQVFLIKSQSKKTRLSLTSDAQKSMPQAICKGPAISTG